MGGCRVNHLRFPQLFPMRGHHLPVARSFVDDLVVGVGQPTEP